MLPKSGSFRHWEWSDGVACSSMTLNSSELSQLLTGVSLEGATGTIDKEQESWLRERDHGMTWGERE
jgi:hypothetical protein